MRAVMRALWPAKAAAARATALGARALSTTSVAPGSKGRVVLLYR